MKTFARRVAVATLALFLAACEGPFGLASGGELSGTVAAPPSTWQLDEEVGFAQLETRPDNPYSVNIAAVELEGRLYVYAGNTRTNWVQHIEQNPHVRIRIQEVIYPLSAVRVEDRDEFVAFAAEWAGRSMFQRDPMQFDEVWLYRLENRD